MTIDLIPPQPGDGPIDEQGVQRKDEVFMATQAGVESVEMLIARREQEASDSERMRIIEWILDESRIIEGRVKHYPTIDATLFGTAAQALQDVAVAIESGIHWKKA